MRLLFIDEDQTFGRVLVKFLTAEGHAVDWIPDEYQSSHTSHPSLRHGYDCMVLGLTAPEDHSETQLQALRGLLLKMPCLVISSRQMPGARVAFLDLGADDVLLKPVELAEVSARIRAITRRSSRAEASDAEIRHGALTLDPSRRIALWKDKVVTLTKKEFWVLETLVRHRNQIVSRSRLEDTLYGWRNEIESNSIEVHIHHLRRKLNRELIKTVRGLGYTLGAGECTAA